MNPERRLSRRELLIGGALIFGGLALKSGLDKVDKYYPEELPIFEFERANDIRGFVRVFDRVFEALDGVGLSLQKDNDSYQKEVSFWNKDVYEKTSYTLSISINGNHTIRSFSKRFKRLFTGSHELSFELIDFRLHDSGRVILANSQGKTIEAKSPTPADWAEYSDTLYYDYLEYTKIHKNSLKRS